MVLKPKIQRLGNAVSFENFLIFILETELLLYRYLFYRYAYLFFNNRGNTKARQIQESFKHNSVFDSVLGIDFDTVNVTGEKRSNKSFN